MVPLLTTDPILANELAIILLLVSGLLSKSIFVPEILQYFKMYLNIKINKILHYEDKWELLMPGVRDAIIKSLGKIDNIIFLLAKHLSRVPTLEPITKEETVGRSGKLLEWIGIIFVRLKWSGPWQAHQEKGKKGWIVELRARLNLCKWPKVLLSRQAVYGIRRACQVAGPGW